MEKIQYVFENLPIIIPVFCTALGLPAFCVSLVTQMLKELPLIKKLPTNALVLGLSLCASGFIYFGAVRYGFVAFSWFLFLASFILGFFIAYVAINDWRELYALWQRFAKK